MVWSSGGNGRHRVALRAAMSVLGVAAALALPAAAQAANTWSGTWINSAPDGSFWVFSQSGSGQSVGGVWKGNASSGTLSGAVAGSNLSGTFVNNEAGLSANFSITLAPDGHSFSGTFTIVGGATGQWRSACSGGACLSNAAPPVLPPIVPPGGGAPAPQTSPKLLAAAAAWGQAGPAAVLGPGEQAIATSPPISAKQREVDIAVNDGTLGAEVLLNIAVGVTPEPKKKSTLRGDCVRSAVGAAQLIRDLAADSQRTISGYTPPHPPSDTSVDELFAFTMFLTVCLDRVKELEEQAHQAGLPPVSAARAACKLRFRAMNVRFDSAAHTINYRLRRASRKEPVRLLRTSCRKARNGTVTLRIRTASRRVKLRKLFGSRLVVGLHRPAAASGTAKVQATFKR